MHNVKEITKDLFWVGGNDRRLSLFEGVYSVPNGVSYNSYVLKDDKTVIFDTVDKAVSEIFFDNLEYVLDGKNPDYLVVQHMEPDHSATLKELIRIYPDITIVCNEKTKNMIYQFFEFKNELTFKTVKEGETLETGHHTLNFVMAPMVHWPEVMVTYDSVDKILFSADAFGTFGALNGAIFADEVDFDRDYMSEARRYYTNIVGKYGTQVQMLLKKASNLEINYICPLHGFVWRYNLNDFIDKYQKWSTYTPEENGVMIAYASVYGHTALTADIISSKLRDKGIKTVMFDVSVTPASDIISEAFRWSHLLFASTTYNAGVFVSMEELLHDLAAHNIQNRTVAFVENGSWAATSGKLMKEILSSCKNLNFIENTVSIKSSLKETQIAEVDALVDVIAKDFEKSPAADNIKEISPNAFEKISYGLYLILTNDGNHDNACVVNTVLMTTDNPKRISVTINKQNYTHDIVAKTKKFNVSVLSEIAGFKVYERFGFHSGRDTNKFEDTQGFEKSSNGLLYMKENSNAYFSADVENIVDCGTHSIFIARVNEAKVLSDVPSVTYDYYFKHVKPKPQTGENHKTGYVCKICGYFYEGKTIPDDFVCPLCKHGVQDFEFVE